ncbi:OmpA family protein [Chitinibacteraceae bacterium HSL-7]
MVGCASVPDGGHATGEENALQRAFWSADPCSNNARNIGLAIGVVGGAVLGKYLGDGKTGAMLGGAAVGLIVGGLIGQTLDNRRCELAKIAKANQLEIQYAPIDQNGNVLAAGEAPGSKDAVIGMTVSVRDEAGEAEQFVPGSDQLTPRAREYFAQIAKQYNPQLEARALPESERKAYMESVGQRKILLVGHTDDTGPSKFNAELSERRARAVAQVLKAGGVPAASLYYQGAGETMPVADNSDVAGRLRNRRVEIVDVLGGETGFKRYLEARQPRYDYYRTAAETPDASRETKTATRTKRDPQGKGTGTVVASASANTSTSPVKGSKMEPATPSISGKSAPKPKPKSVAGSGLDFGGDPMTAQNRSLALGPLIQDDPGFTLISKAYASDSPVVGSCQQDRPRQSGAVRALDDGKEYRVAEHLPGLYGTTWADQVGGHTIVLNKVSVLRDGARADTQPEFKVYANYDPSKNRNPKPTLELKPQVNTYKGKNGVLYRVFTGGQQGIECMDVLFPLDGGKKAKSGLLAYSRQGQTYIAGIQPKVLGN